MTDHDTALDDRQPDDADKFSDVHKRAMERFRRAVEPQQLVRTYSLAARRVSIVPGALWEGDYGESFDKAVKLDIHKLGKAIRKAENDYRQNRIVPDFRPAGGNSDNDTADTLDGMHRADSYFYKSQQARDNAFSEASRGGFGAYRLTTEWADPLDKDNDEQRVNPGLTIVDADQTVFFDPDSKLYDKSDARFAFVLTGHSPDSFKTDWPDAKYTSWPDSKPLYWGDWYKPEQILVCEYYEVEERNESLLIYTLPATGEEQRHWERELDAEDREELEATGWTLQKRRVKRRRCHKWVMSGAEVLKDQGLTPGGNIPIVPVYANRDYVDGVEWFVGVLPSSKIDAARLYAAMVSNLAEIQAMAPYERPIFAPEQMPPNLAEMWARGNIDRHPYALVNPLLDPVTGAVLSAGALGKVEPPSMPQTLAALLEIANRDVTEDDQDGAEEVRANTSADAMDIAAARVDAKTGVLLDNMRQSVQREGELYLGMAREVYVEEGREVETMTEDGDDGVATLAEDYSDNGILKTRNDFATGRYKVIASVTEATATRRDRTVKQMLGLAEIAIKAGDQAGSQAALITAGENMDGEGLDEWRAWNRKRGLELGLFKPTEDEQRAAAQEQESQQPDPASLVAGAQVKALEAGAAKDVAQARAAGMTAQSQATERLANAQLKLAQANAVGGPEQAPEAPSGLTAANDQANVEERFASADLKRAQARKIDHDIHDQRIRTGAEFREMERQGAA